MQGRLYAVLVLAGSVSWTSAAAAADSELGVDLVKAGRVIGMAVKNSRNETLGEIAEVVLDATDGRVKYVVLASGGFLGMGEDYFALPWSALRRNSKGTHFILDIEREQLKETKGFDKDRWPREPDLRWDRKAARAAPNGEPPKPRNGEGDFVAGTRREGTNLHLDLRKGQTHRFRLLEQPREAAAEPNGETNGPAPLDLEIELYVQDQIEGEHDVRVTIQGSGYVATTSLARVDRTGRVIRLGRSNGADQSSGLETTEAERERKLAEECLADCLQNLLGYGLHTGKLEPGRSYGNWVINGQESVGPAAGTEDQESYETYVKEGKSSKVCKLRYEGIKEINGRRSAIFLLEDAAKEFGRKRDNGAADAEGETEGTDVSADRERIRSSEGLGRVAYRINDGMLEAAVLSCEESERSFLVHRISPRASEGVGQREIDD